MIYNFTIKDDKLKERPDLNLNSGNVESYIFRFNFDSSWNNLIIIATFIKDNTIYNIPLQNNEITVPYEILQNTGTCTFGIFGTNPNDVYKISTNLISFNIKQGAYIKGKTPELPTNDVWENLIRKSIPKIQNNMWYIYDLPSEKYVSTNITAIGYTPEKGIDYFTIEDIESLGISEKEDKKNMLKFSDLSSSDWVNSDLYSDTKYVSSIFIKKLLDYIHINYLNRIDTIGNIHTREKLSNKISKISLQPDNTHYTSEKAVADYVSDSLKKAIFESWEAGI